LDFFFFCFEAAAAALDIVVVVVVVAPVVVLSSTMVMVWTWGRFYELGFGILDLAPGDPGSNLKLSQKNSLVINWLS
jgi:hypothetical protein